jgi:hypothetical protein
LIVKKITFEKGVDKRNKKNIIIIDKERGNKK